MGLLRVNALAWAMVIWAFFSSFTAELRKVFCHTFQGMDAAKHLLSLCQGSRSVAEYSVESRNTAAESSWNDTALQGVFLRGLSDQVKDELAIKEKSESLN